MSEITEVPESQPKKTRKPYTRRPVAPAAPVPLPPEPPNPAIAALQGEILEFVRMRSAAQAELGKATQQLQYAQASMQYAKGEFDRLDGEVQYRMSLIQQMRGGTPIRIIPEPLAPQRSQFLSNPYMTMPGEPYPPPQSPSYAPANPYPPYPVEAISSEPAPNRGLYPDLVGDANGALSMDAPRLSRAEIESMGRGR